jgi:hypothetical protein
MINAHSPLQEVLKIPGAFKVFKRYGIRFG